MIRSLEKSSYRPPNPKSSQRDLSYGRAGRLGKRQGGSPPSTRMRHHPFKNEDFECYLGLKE